MSRICKFDDGKFGLELNQDELDTLDLILSRIGGNPDTTRRKFADQIREGTIKYANHHLNVNETGSIIFYEE